MAGFLYFRSTPQNVTREQVAQWGLDYAFGGKIENRQTLANSPSGTAGCVFVDPERHQGKTIGYFPDQQTWRKMPTVEGRPELWVGYWNDAKPGPGDLVRAKQLKGVPVRLSDGHEWEVPTVRSFDGTEQCWKSELPSAWTCGDDGQLVRGTKPKAIYAYLWDITAPIADKLFSIAAGDGGDMPSDAELGRAVVSLLGTNYVIDAVEIAALELIGTDEAYSIVMVATRYDTLFEWMNLKKTADQSTESIVTLCDGAAA